MNGTRVWCQYVQFNETKPLTGGILRRRVEGSFYADLMTRIPTIATAISALTGAAIGISAIIGSKRG
jgi:hypothetical protein